MTSKSSRRQQRRLPAPFHPLNPTRAVFAGASIPLAFHASEETRARETCGGRESETMPSYPLPSATLLFRRLSFSSCVPLPSVPYSTHRSPGARFACKYRLSYSFEGAENRYGAFCARATGEIPNRRCRRSFSHALGLALARLAAYGPPLVGV